MSKIGKFVSSIVELFSREVKVSGVDRIYTNDADNLYPNRVELVERNSVTALASSRKMKAFIVGKGFVNQSFNEMIVNKKKNINGYQFLTKLANSLSTHRGAFIHVGYNIEGEVKSLDVLAYKKCRVSKEDSTGYPGKIYYGDWQDVKKISFGKDSKMRWYYPFGKDNVLDQMRKDAIDAKIDANDLESMVTNYRGQVYFINLDDTEVYPFAWVDSAYNDADSEYRTSLYRNTNLRTGFLNKTIIIPNGIDEESAESFGDDVKNWLGAENSSGVFIYRPDQYVDDPSKLIATIELKGSYDSKRFEHDEESIENKIRKAYLSIPKILIDPQDSFFGSSGEAFKEAVKYYNAETLHLREAISYTMDRFYNGDFTIKQLGDDER